MLKHIESLEKQKEKLEAELKTEKFRNEKMSAKTREGMQSALDTLMKKWMDAVETKDDKIKDQFKDGMNKLVQNSAEETAAADEQQWPPTLVRLFDCHQVIPLNP